MGFLLQHCMPYTFYNTCVSGHKDLIFTQQLSGKDVDAPFNFIASQFHELYVEKLQQVSKN